MQTASTQYSVFEGLASRSRRSASYKFPAIRWRCPLQQIFFVAQASFSVSCTVTSLWCRSKRAFPISTASENIISQRLFCLRQVYDKAVYVGSLSRGTIRREQDSMSCCVLGWICSKRMHGFCDGGRGSYWKRLSNRCIFAIIKELIQSLNDQHDVHSKWGLQIYEGHLPKKHNEQPDCRSSREHSDRIL